MNRSLRNICIILFAATYFAASQVTVLSIVAAWYSTTADSALATHAGLSRDLGVPAWTPRTHALVFQNPELSQGLPASLFLYPAQRAYRVIQADRPPDRYIAFYYSDLCNKAPPRS